MRVSFNHTLVLWPREPERLVKEIFTVACNMKKMSIVCVLRELSLMNLMHSLLKLRSLKLNKTKPNIYSRYYNIVLRRRGVASVDH